MKKISSFFALLSLLLVFSCGSQKAFVYPEHQVLPKEKSLLWKISENGTKKASYLYGTIHIIPKEDYSVTPEVEAALNKSEHITFEIDMKDMMNIMAQFKLMTKAFMKNGTTLRDLLSPEDYAFVRREMDTMGLPSTMLERLKPMFLSTMLSTDGDATDMLGGGADSDMTSVEMELYQRSKKQKMPSSGLESMEYQIGLFDSIPYQVQADMLLETLRADDESNDSFEKLVELYKSQDVANMHDYMNESEEGGIGGYEDILLYNRNRHWIPKIAALVRTQPTFFAVGAGHLGGDQGVIALLRRAGFKVEAVLHQNTAKNL